MHIYNVCRYEEYDANTNKDKAVDEVLPTVLGLDASSC
jgi:hypothetical protein